MNPYIGAPKNPLYFSLFYPPLSVTTFPFCVKSGTADVRHFAGVDCKTPGCAPLGLAIPCRAAACFWGFWPRHSG